MKKFYQLSNKSFANYKVKTYKTLWEKIKDKGYDGFVITCFVNLEKKANSDNSFSGVFSTSTVDRHGDVVKQNWDLNAFKKNPVLLDSHNYNSIEHIIGRVNKIKVKEDKLVGDVEFALDNPKGLLAYKLALNKFLNAFSVGFIPVVFGDKGEFEKSELLELSSVPVPANPESLMEKLYDTTKDEKNLSIKRPNGSNAKQRGNSGKRRRATSKQNSSGTKSKVSTTKRVEDKAVIPFSVHGEGPKAPIDAGWDAGAEVKKASGDGKKLKTMMTWVDSGAEGFEADERKWYKLPHHKGDGAQPVVWRGVAAAMAALLGARGGVDIPDNDKQGVYTHLKKHYAQFDKEPPELKQYTEKEILELFPVEKQLDKKNKALHIIALAAKHLGQLNKVETRESVKAKNVKLINKAVRQLLKAKKY